MGKIRLCRRAPVIDALGDHMRVCCLALKRHNMMYNSGTGLLSELARNCGYTSTVEPRKFFETDRARPDITIHRYHAYMAKPAALDLTFPCASAFSNMAVAAKSTGALSNKAEDMKLTKYFWRAVPLALFLLRSGDRFVGSHG